jgi:iron complex transport system substrate-binding protein
MRLSQPAIGIFAALFATVGGAAAAGPIPAAAVRPMHVMSINECTDQIVLALLPPDRIASVTWLSRDPQSSLMAKRAQQVGINHGLSEEVLHQRPDLVVAGTYTTTSTRAMLKRLGWPLLEIGPSDTIDQIRATTRRVASAVNEVDRGNALIAQMDRQIAEIGRHPVPRVRVAAWDGAGFSAGKGTLYNTVLRLAGFENIAADPKTTQRGPPATELLLAAAPALIIQGGLSNQQSLRADIAYHPLVRRYWGAGRTLTIRPAYYICGTPFVADEALHLRAELRAKLTAARTPLPFAIGARP